MTHDKITTKSLQWLHNERDGVSNHQHHDCLLNRLFRRRSKKTSKLRATGLCDGNSSVIGGFPSQEASNAENVSIWWRHHVHPIITNMPPFCRLLKEKLRILIQISLIFVSKGQIENTSTLVQVMPWRQMGDMPLPEPMMTHFINVSTCVIQWVKKHLHYLSMICGWFDFVKAQIKISKLRVAGLCEGNSLVTGEFPTRRASNAENVSIWWYHYENTSYYTHR